jgi:outer membrane lipoprotein-sorting protein
MKKSMAGNFSVWRAVLLGIFLFSITCAFLGADEAKWKAILDNIDAASNFTGVDFSAEVTIVSEKPGKAKEVLKSKFFRRDKDDQFLILMIEPPVQKGKGYLKEGDKVWIYDPNTRTFVFELLQDNFAGSRANNSDFSASSLSRDYLVQSAVDGKLGSRDVWILDLKAKTASAPYAWLKLWVQKDRYLVLMQQELDLSKKPMRTSVYSSHAQVAGRWIPLSQLFRDEVNVGEKSQMTINKDKISVGKIPDSVFTKAYIEGVNR